MKKRVLPAMVLAMAATGVSAAGLEGIYAGGGIGINDLDGFGGSATGFQIFAGMPLPIKTGAIKSAVEVGYMKSGEFEECVNTGFYSYCATGEVDGLWATYVASLPINNKVDVLGRIGLDFGDDDGLMFGVGAGFGINEKLGIRAEYVMRDHLDSLQANVVYKIK